MMFFLRRKPMSTTRREVLFLLSGLVSSAVALEGLPSQDNSLPSATYAFSELPLNNASGPEIRPVLKGKLATAESLEVHETTLPPGGMPHPAHHHVHSEMWLFGKVQYNSRSMASVM
jgi:hypothetical protein